MVPEGPGRGFLVRDLASPGVACSTLVPRRALLASAQAIKIAPSELVPQGAKAVSLKLVARHSRVSSRWLYPNGD